MSRATAQTDYSSLARLADLNEDTLLLRRPLARLCVSDRFFDEAARKFQVLPTVVINRYTSECVFISLVSNPDIVSHPQRPLLQPSLFLMMVESMYISVLPLAFTS